MAENKEYYTQKVENGSIQISEDVVASVAAMAVMEQEGVCGLSTGIGSDIAEMLGMKSAAKGVRIVSDKEGRLFVECNVVANFGYSVFELAKNVQDAVRSSLESVTGLNYDQNKRQRDRGAARLRDGLPRRRCRGRRAGAS